MQPLEDQAIGNMGKHHPPDPDFTQLVEQHYSLLYKFAYRLSGSFADAEDLTQHAFLTAQKKIHQLRSRDRVQAWLLTIVRNSYLKQQRRESRQRISLESVAEPEVCVPENTDVDSEQLQKILSEMPEDFRVVIILFYFRELSYKHIAECVDIPLGTVMSRLARGKRYLKRRLMTECLSTDLSRERQS